MAILSRKTKGKLAVKTAKALAKNPELARAGGKAAVPAAKLRFKIARPLAKRRVRRKAERFADAIRTTANTLAEHGPQAAQELGLVAAPKRSRRAPLVAAGAVMGASVVYFLEPAQGAQHRQQVLKLVR